MLLYLSLSLSLSWYCLFENLVGGGGRLRRCPEHIPVGPAQVTGKNACSSSGGVNPVFSQVVGVFCNVFVGNTQIGYMKFLVRQTVLEKMMALKRCLFTSSFG